MTWTPYPEYETGQDKFLDTLMGTMSKGDFESPYVKAVLYGDWGSGKSFCAATAGKNILWIDVAGERGYLSLMNHIDENGEPYSNRVKQVMTLIKGSELDQVKAVCQYITQGKLQGFDTIVVDTVSALVDADMDAILRQKTKELRMGNKNAPEFDRPEWPEYNRNANRVRWALEELAEVPVNVVMTSQARDDEDKFEAGKSIARPWIPDKAQNRLAQFTHLFAYMTVDGEGGNREYLMQVHPTKRVKAKCRIQVNGESLPIVLKAGKNRPINLRELFNSWAAQATKINQERGLI